MVSQVITKVRSFFSNGSNQYPGVFAFGRSVVLTSVVVTGVVFGMRQLGILEGWELGAYDQLMRSRPDQGADNRLLVVGITDGDIQARKEYPLSDGTMAQLLEKLQSYQPRAIGLDILRDVRQGNPAGRVALQKILQQSENLIAVCKLSSASQPGIPAAPGVPQQRVGFNDLPLDPSGTVRRSVLVSTPGISKVPTPNKHLCNIPDPNNQIPSFSLQLALLYMQPKGIKPEPTPSGEMKLGSTVFHRLTENAGGYHNADAEDYRIMLNYRSAKNSVKQVSLENILDGEVDPALVKDRIVLVGYTAPSVKDDFNTPYSAGEQDDQKMPGIVIHAQNTSQILSTVLDNRPLIWCWSEGSKVLWILSWSLVGAILAWRSRRLWLFGLGVIAAVGVLYGTSYVLFLNSGWIPLVPPLLALVTTAVIVVLVDKGYAKAIYQGVRNVILNIEIDEQKKRQQVAEITETESFAELEKKADILRNRRRDRQTGKAAVENSANSETAQAALDSQPAQEDDYFQQLQRRGKNLRSTESETPQRPIDSESTEDAQEDDYFQQLQRRGKRLRNTEDESN